MDIISKQDAMEQGLKTYYTGQICSNGHDDTRRVETGRCSECQRKASREHNRNNPEANRARAAEWSANNPDRVKARFSRKREHYNTLSRLRYYRKRYSIKDV